ncbi:MAG: hypothetical protein HW377_1462 [Actinobacteria bacterium]|nr:hypothetical protein [Actinomycetota bacterium]
MDGAEAQHVFLSMRNNSQWVVYRGTPDWAPMSAGNGSKRETEYPPK